MKALGVLHARIPGLRTLSIALDTYNIWESVPDLDALVQFIASFDRLETLVVEVQDSESYNIPVLLEGVIARTKIRTIYQNAVVGAYFDRLRTYAVAHSVELIYGGLPPPTFPVVYE
jgi:hypothetical protein